MEHESQYLKDENKLTLTLPFPFEVFSHLWERSTSELFKFFRDFSSDTDLMISTEYTFELPKRSHDPMYWLIDYDCVDFFFEWEEKGLSSLFHWEKSEIEILMRVESTCHECRENRWRSWDRRDSYTERNSLLNKKKSRITDSRGSCIWDEGDVFSSYEKIEDFFSFRKSWMRMKREESSIIRYLVVFEEFPGDASILTGDRVCLTEYTESTEGDIFEVPDGSRDDAQESCHQEFYYRLKLPRCFIIMFHTLASLCSIRVASWSNFLWNYPSSYIPSLSRMTFTS